VSTSPAVAHACRRNDSYILHFEHLYRAIPSQSTHPDITLVVRNLQKQQKGGPSGKSRLPHAKRSVSTRAGKRYSSRGGGSTATTIHGQNSTPSSLLNNFGTADITQHLTSIPSRTQRWSIHSPTTTLGTSSRSTPAPGGMSQVEFTCHVVSRITSGIASTPTPLSGLEYLPTPNHNPKAHATIPNPLQTPATEMNQRLRQWQLQPQAVSTPQSMVFASGSIHQFGHSDMTRLVFAKGRLLELYTRNRWPFMRASNLEMVSYATRRAAKASAEAPHWQII